MLTVNVQLYCSYFEGSYMIQLRKEVIIRLQISEISEGEIYRVFQEEY
jgi:hypothetical protein